MSTGMRWSNGILVTGFLLLVTAFNVSAVERDITVWMSPGGPRGIWEKSCGDPVPVKKLVEDLAYVGVTEILFFEQEGRGGSFLHPTAVPHAVTSQHMKGRDFLRELLEETAKCNIRVWLAWTPPSGKYPGTDFEGLNHPEVLRIYTDEIEEVARNYKKFRNLAGFMWHEVDCSEAVDRHEDDVKEFSDFCHRKFDEKYENSRMPKVDAQDKWWRRFFLYRNHVVNEFIRQMAGTAHRHGLKTHFCSYTPESYIGESWKWGYDIVALEELCDRQWFNGYSVESGKPYQQVKGACLDFGPSYRGQILARNYAYAMHGLPVSYFEYRSPVYLDEIRRYYGGIKSFSAAHGDFYTGYLGRQAKEVELYYGRENLRKWIGMMACWQGGRSTARVAVAVNPNDFIMRNPLSSGAEYEKKVRSLMTTLTGVTDVDGLLLESRFALKYGNLLNYSLIVIPEDMGCGLSRPMVKCLRKYVDKGGCLLVVSTQLMTSGADLTDEEDFTRQFCGLEITGNGQAGYVAPVGTSFPVSGEKFWSGSVKQVRLHGAEPCVNRQGGGEPLLFKNKNVYFSTAGCSAEASRYFADIVSSTSRQPVALTGNTDLRILEGVERDGVVCLSMWGNGKAKLQIDAAGLDLLGQIFRVKDVASGTLIGDFTREQLAGGIPVEIKHLYQPVLLTVGPAAKIDAFPGLYASADVFTGMKAKVSQDDPEVPREALDESPVKADTPAIPLKPLVRDKEIGVLDYSRKYEVKLKRSADEALKSWIDLIQKNGLSLETVDADIFLPPQRVERNRFRRIFIPPGADWFNRKMYEGMNEYVRDGGLLVTGSGLLLLDANSNYRPDDGSAITELARETFLGVRAHASATMHRIKVVQSCPLTAGLAPSTWIELGTTFSGRETTSRSAEVIIISDRSKKDEVEGEQPFLTYKHSGRGACIYLVGIGGKTTDKTFVQLLSNILSRTTLDWLCAQ